MNPPPISLQERRDRLQRLEAAMQAQGIAALMLDATSSLRYFTGLSWYRSERLIGALVRPGKPLTYVCPRFELDKVAGVVGVPGEFLTWEEHESPYALVADAIGATGKLAVDEKAPVFAWLGLAEVMGADRMTSAGPLTTALRARKSATEIALMTRAKALTLEAHRRAHASLQAGVRASEIVAFIDAQHRALGADGGNTFCIVSFGADTSLPHGGEGDPALRDGDVVLIDTGCALDGYNADITRTYVFGEPDAEVRRIWDLEHAAQARAFEAARLGEPCEAVDAAVRVFLKAEGLGPDYQLPGTPHRTGHGIGLDIHEAPYLVRGDRTALDVGMCFSNEPMIVVPGRFGIRLEDHFHMTETGPKWFTQPQPSLDEPFRGVAPLAA
jgi:Xaa-Pro dipeptidase